jgi:hypothetical protein
MVDTAMAEYMDIVLKEMPSELVDNNFQALVDREAVAILADMPAGVHNQAVAGARMDSLCLAVVIETETYSYSLRRIDNL